MVNSTYLHNCHGNSQIHVYQTIVNFSIRPSHIHILYIIRDVISRMQYTRDEILFRAIHIMPFRVLNETDFTLIKSMTIIILSHLSVVCHPMRHITPTQEYFEFPCPRYIRVLYWRKSIAANRVSKKKIRCTLISTSPKKKYNFFLFPQQQGSKTRIENIS